MFTFYDVSVKKKDWKQKYSRHSCFWSMTAWRLRNDLKQFVSLLRFCFKWNRSVLTWRKYDWNQKHWSISQDTKPYLNNTWQNKRTAAQGIQTNPNPITGNFPGLTPSGFYPVHWVTSLVGCPLLCVHTSETLNMRHISEVEYPPQNSGAGSCRFEPQSLLFLGLTNRRRKSP